MQVLSLQDQKKMKYFYCYSILFCRKQSALGVAKGFAHIEGKSIFGGKLGYLNSGFVKQMGLDKVRFILCCIGTVLVLNFVSFSVRDSDSVRIRLLAGSEQTFLSDDAPFFMCFFYCNKKYLFKSFF
jgi:hypothetical protein